MLTDYAVILYQAISPAKLQRRTCTHNGTCMYGAAVWLVTELKRQMAHSKSITQCGYYNFHRSFLPYRQRLVLYSVFFVY